MEHRVFPGIEADIFIPIDPDGRRVIISNHPKMKEILRIASSVANSKAPVLVQGASGTGKELLASYIHQQSFRAKHPLVAINCAAIPARLL